jgi:hypothetical protein
MNHTKDFNPIEETVDETKTQANYSLKNYLPSNNVDYE